MHSGYSPSYHPLDPSRSRRQQHLESCFSLRKLECKSIPLPLPTAQKLSPAELPSPGTQGRCPAPFSHLQRVLPFQLELIPFCSFPVWSIFVLWGLLPASEPQQLTACSDASACTSALSRARAPCSTVLAPRELVPFSWCHAL